MLVCYIDNFGGVCWLCVLQHARERAVFCRWHIFGSCCVRMRVSGKWTKLISAGFVRLDKTWR